MRKKILCIVTIAIIFVAIAITFVALAIIFVVIAMIVVAIAILFIILLADSAKPWSSCRGNPSAGVGKFKPGAGKH